MKESLSLYILEIITLMSKLITLSSEVSGQFALSQSRLWWSSNDFQWKGWFLGIPSVCPDIDSQYVYH